MKFKSGDRVFIKPFNCAGTVKETYVSVFGRSCVVAIPDVKENITIRTRDKVETSTITAVHLDESDCKLIGQSKPEPDWASIWENQ